MRRCCLSRPLKGMWKEGVKEEVMDDGEDEEQRRQVSNLPDMLDRLRVRKTIAR